MSESCPLSFLSKLHRNRIKLTGKHSFKLGNSIVPRIDKVIVVILEGHKIKLPPSAMMYMLQTDFVTRIKEDKIYLFIYLYLYFLFFYCSSSTVISVSPPPLPHPSHPHLPPWIRPASGFVCVSFIESSFCITYLLCL